MARDLVKDAGPPARSRTPKPEQRIAMWICSNASSFELFDTKPRATVIGFVHEEDADAFRREFVR